MLTKSPEETIKFGQRLGAFLKRGDIIGLVGDLGSGKTTLTKGIAKGLNIKNTKYINSPSFVIVKEYEGRIPLYHFDIYRLNSVTALIDIGYEEYFYSNGVVVIEWAKKIKDILPKEHLIIELNIADAGAREILLKPSGKRYAKLIKNVI